MPRKRKYTEEQQIEVDRCNKIRQMLRRAWSKDPKRYEALKNAKKKYKGDNPRQKFEYVCAHCKKGFKQNEVSVDHIIPCGSFLKREQLGEWADRLFYGDLQVLCKVCHNKKTKEDRDGQKDKS